MARAMAGRAALERGATAESVGQCSPLLDDSEDRWKDMEAAIFFGDDILHAAFASDHLAEALAFLRLVCPVSGRPGSNQSGGCSPLLVGPGAATLGDAAAAERTC